MRKQILALLAATLLAPAAFAESANVQVLANVVGTCKFLSAPDVNFGDLDVDAGGDKTAKSDVRFWCTNGTNYTLAVGNGANFDAASSARRMRNAAAGDLLKYELQLGNLSGQGKGKADPVTFTMNALLRSNDYATAKVGAYQDVVQLTVTP
jgi:spore coat protein U-like protein